MNFEQILIELSWQHEGQRLDLWLNTCSRRGTRIHPLAIWPAPRHTPERGTGVQMKTQLPTGETKGTAWRKLESKYLILAGKGWDSWSKYSPKASFHARTSVSASRCWHIREECIQASLQYSTSMSLINTFLLVWETSASWTGCVMHFLVEEQS